MKIEKKIIDENSVQKREREKERERERERETF